ncbi:MAG: lipopolysaccharide assembly protein LapB [gamma proteobacterium symbiont of Bathyaustriella thionipta]|nr:lipopolysaccharide assembly protein LapB [gamma proteobacterium symbiont of Bathyaustriella thionipta]
MFDNSELFLLACMFVLVAAVGWFAGRRSLKNSADNDNTPELNSRYFRGLNYLLNEQPDKAIDVFIKMLDVNSETVETHLALASLFRLRGETERAIRIHQNLIARPGLNKSVRAQALLELGQDYMKAGLFDRAESLFKELVDLNLHQEAALKNLWQIYQQEKDWPQALKIASDIEHKSGQATQLERVHFLCEMAEEALRNRQHNEALRWIRQAQVVDADMPRSLLLQAEFEKEKARYKQAIKLYMKAAEQYPLATDQVIEPLKDCFHKQGKIAALKSALERLLALRPNARVVIALAEMIEASDGNKAAIDFTAAYLQREADLRVLHHLSGLFLRSSTLAGQHKPVLQMVNNMLAEMLRQTTDFQCGQCGYKANKLLWHCPGCGSWSRAERIKHGR